MQMPPATDLVRKEALMDLLSDDEVTRVTADETRSRLTEGEQFVDLDHLERGVQRANGAQATMGSVLTRRAVQEETWAKIVGLLTSNAVAPHPR